MDIGPEQPPFIAEPLEDPFKAKPTPEPEAPEAPVEEPAKVSA